MLAQSDDDEFVPIEQTEFWKEMSKNRVGNLLAAGRLRASLTQAQLAKKLSIRQNVISDYERGRRQLSPAMAKRICRVRKIKVERLLPR